MTTTRHTWGRERRRDGPSEWVCTGDSTLSGELMDETKPRRRRHRGAYLRFALPLLVLLALSVGGIVAIAHLRG